MTNPNFETRLECEICDGRDNITLHVSDFADGATWDFLSTYYRGRVEKSSVTSAKYTLLECVDCGFVWQSEVLDDPSMEVLYEKWISPDESLEKFQSRAPEVVKAIAWEAGLIRYLLKKRRGQRVRVLDFGMGWGGWCLAAMAEGYEAYGVELSSTRLEYARSKGVKGVKVLDDVPNDLDFINTEQVFEHVKDPKQLLKDLASKLDRGGIIRISVPNGRNFKRRFRRGIWSPGKDAVHPLEHINCFDHRSLLRLSASCGLSPLPISTMLNSCLPTRYKDPRDFRWAVKGFLRHQLLTGVYFEKHAATSGH